MSGCVDPGEILAIRGTSGAGKPKFFHILSGLLISNNLRGQVLVNGRLVNCSSFKGRETVFLSLKHS